MTIQPDPLAAEFAARRPDALAGFLAGVEPNELREFLATLPRVSAAALLARLPSWQITSVLKALDAALLADLLVEAKPEDTVALVSHLHTSAYPRVLEACAPAKHGELQRILQFPSQSLAALVSSEFIRVKDTVDCGSFSEQLSRGRPPRARPVLVVTDNGTYCGIADPLAVFARINRTRTLGELAQKIEPLSSRMPAAAALTAPQWQEHTVLPVVDVHSRVVGVVRKSLLYRVAGQAASTGMPVERALRRLAIDYLQSSSRILALLLGMKSR